jgi:hypothetical protein
MVMMLSRSSLIVVSTVGIACLSINKGVTAFVAPSLSPSLVSNAYAARVVRPSSSLFHNAAPKHDVSAGGNPWANLTPEQVQRVQAYQEHQQNAAKIGFPTDVRSLIQYNHGFAVMGTNSKS